MKTLGEVAYSTYMKTCNTLPFSKLDPAEKEAWEETASRVVKEHDRRAKRASFERVDPGDRTPGNEQAPSA